MNAAQQQQQQEEVYFSHFAVNDFQLQLQLKIAQQSQGWASKNKSKSKHRRLTKFISVFKWTNYGLFFVYFRSFQTNISSILQLINVKKCPYSTRI